MVASAACAPGTKLVFLASKGETRVHMFECIEEDPFVQVCDGFVLARRSALFCSPPHTPSPCARFGERTRRQLAAVLTPR